MHSLFSEFFRKVSFNLLGLNGYLALVRKSFFIAYNSGYLKHDPTYSWHYFVSRVLRRGDIVIDIGANMGYYSTIFSKSVSKQGKVYCVEPVVPLYRQLAKQLNHQDNICLIPYALGDQDVDTVTISVPAHLAHLGYLRHGYLSLQPSQPSVDSKYSFPVQLRKGSDLFSRLGRLDYIKCDIEGHELTVFKDMKQLLARHRPIVQVEISHTNFGQMTELFYELGYKGYKLIYGNLIDIENLPLKEKLPLDTLFVSAKYFYRVTPFLDPAATTYEGFSSKSSKVVKQPHLPSNPYFSS